MERLYSEKDKMQYYNWARDEVINFIQKHFQQGNKAINVLEVGCGSGETGRLLKNMLEIEQYYGIEMNSDASQQAALKIDKVITGDFERMMEKNEFHGIDKIRYDLILFLDVLEHMYDPWSVLRTVQAWLAKNGRIACSIPNAGNIYVLKKLFKDRFIYEDRGLLDKTHIRFFTLYTINNMLEETGYQMEHCTTTTDLFIPKLKILNILTFGCFKKQFIRQYIFIAKPLNG